MPTLIAELQAEPLFLMSVVKPVLVLLALIAWAMLVGRLDKDADYYHLGRTTWGMAHMGAGLVGFALMWLVPIFWIGFPLGLIVLAGEAFGYIAFRNGKVPEKARWSGLDILKQVQAAQEEKAGRKAMEQSEIKLMDKSEGQLEIPHGSDPRTPAFELFQNMLIFAVPRGADLLEMTVDAEKAKFVARIDGIRYPQEAPDTKLSVQLIDYLKEHAGMDLNERRRKQTGKMWVDVEGSGKHTLELSTAGSTRSLQLQIEIDPDGRMNIPLKALGLTPVQHDKLDELTKELTKVVVLSSPPRCGTTTSMYSLMQSHDPYTSSVMTLEKEKAFEIEGVNHNTFPEGGGNEQIMEKFGALLRSDPNVMMVSQVVNTDMARMIAQQAEDTRMYLPLPANDTLSGLKLWMKVVGDKRLAAESLGAVISQRLVRKLCHTCRVPYTPTPDALKKLKIKPDGDTQLYKASGKIMVKDQEQVCPACHGLGYRGRVGIFEVMFVDTEARSLIASGEGERLKAHLRKQRMTYLQEAALAKVVEGVTDIKEVTRAMGEHQKG